MRAILFVCTGNICRSPTAEGILAHKAAAKGLTLEIDSAGVSSEELGNRTDSRARLAAAARGYQLPDRYARQIRADDFARFDLILGMTQGHVRAMRHRQPQGSRATLGLMMDYAPQLGTKDVPDPWYGGSADFELALNMIETACDGLIACLQNGDVPRA
ncbi:MAG: low molecular weight protein-tyrosine-phosphatase [Geminicoccaceae bacterium]